jgi:head-tail adaptor
MDAGQLDSRITVKNQISSSIDVHGEVIPFYATASIWTKAKSMNGTENTPNGVQVVRSMYSFTIRDGASVVDESSVIVFNGFEYNIRYLDTPFGRGSWLVIQAERVV